MNNGMGDNKDYEKLMLAAVVHDIGKFWQGTGEKGTHQELSAKFVRAHIPEQWQGAAALVSEHHDDRNFIPEVNKHLKILMISDWLSSGELDDNETEIKIHEPLVSIFSDIDIGKGIPSKKSYISVKKLAIDDETLFPNKMEGTKNFKADYLKQWNEFVGEVDKIRNISDFNSYFNSLYHILQKYTWCLPSAVYENVPDISLFDHLKSTCAIASCLSEVSDETFPGDVLKALFDKEATTNEKNSLKDEKFILIGGDLSGIQKFIYSVTSKGAAKGLRGRSFYLQLLTEAISNYILCKLEISKANLLYCGGGHFYILAASSAASNLEDIRKKSIEILLKHHQGDFYLALDWIAISSRDFQEKRFGSKWDEIVAKLAVRKKHKFSEILNNEHHDSIFGPMGGSKDVCEICGSEKDVQEYEDEKKKCDMCASFEDLADDIAKAKYIVEIIEEKENETKKGWEEVISDFAIGYKFPVEIDERIKKTDAKDITIYYLNNTNFPDYLDIINGAASPISFGFKFIANTTPRENGKIKSFDDFAEKAEGIKKWAVLRMDVDNLGKIFSKGLEKNRSISRISTLSSMFSLFFAGGMEKICENYENIYVIYSGGDDVFIVGQWDIIPTVAKNIYACFKDFTCQNENITLSGGIFIAPDTKFPLYKAADLAGEALDKSKNGGRDKITFFDKDVTWKEFEEIEKMKGYIVSAIIYKHVSRALIFRLAEAFDDFKSMDDGKTSVFRVWRLIYNLNRLARRHKEAEQELKKIEHSFIADNLLKSYVIVPIRWAEFLTRKEGY